MVSRSTCCSTGAETACVQQGQSLVGAQLPSQFVCSVCKAACEPAAPHRRIIRSSLTTDAAACDGSAMYQIQLRSWQQYQLDAMCDSDPNAVLHCSFSKEPVASGSIGQIHRAVLSERGALHTGVPAGTEVAVKVRSLLRCITHELTWVSCAQCVCSALATSAASAGCVGFRCGIRGSGRPSRAILS